MLLVAIWALAEGGLFFLVADVPISWIGLRRGPRAALGAAMLAAPMAAVGGVLLACAVQSRPLWVHHVLACLPGISDRLIDHALGGWQGGGWRAMLAGSFRGVPYKLYAYAAGLSGVPFWRLFGLSVAARLPRFVLVALLSGMLGRCRPVSARTAFALHSGFWLLFYAAYFPLMAGKY